MANAKDDEWEYEYDETETEDFYIPIDLSNIPDAQVPINTTKKPGHPTLLKSRLRALNAARGPIPEAVVNDDVNSQDTTAATLGECQVVGLHTENPLLMYNGQLLSCHWAETVGTDMFFTKPDANAGGLSQPLQSLPSVDLLALGTAKLVARVGRLRPRDENFDKEDNLQSAAAEPSSAMETETASEQPPLVPAGFLAKLNEAKIKRGERNCLVVSNTPEGPRLLAENVSASTSARAPASSSQPSNDVQMGGT